MGNPTGAGGFKRGQSGNPGGRPKELKDIQALARKYGPAALDALIEIAKSGQSESARVAASQALLDRGYGKATQPISGPAEGPIEVDHFPGLTDADRAKAIMTLLGKK